MKTKIQEIHNKFNKAGEELLVEVEKFLSKTVVPNENKAERLKKLGFIKVKEILEVDKIKKELELNQKLAEKIRYYQRTYPLNRFLKSVKNMVL